MLYIDLTLFTNANREISNTNHVGFVSDSLYIDLTLFTNANREISNTNHVGFVSDSLGRLSAAIKCMASSNKCELIMYREADI